ncbi:hypothetical protein NLU13_0982 [Sarocladium strictum]|uniref:NAD dependent epimerase/dehydratase n=1 Tax=Sarocladium strictum TaxID=5046 RepID=A0AA39GQV4_SARSR|nr:hypothetical protein NLU13_0982 [Sarocladium strictum]
MTATSSHLLNGRVVPMRVIVAGVHRTGTLSVRAALWQLGFHDCYHMHTAQANGAVDGPQWARAFAAKYAGKGTFTRADWDQLLGHYQAVCDLPAAFFSAELAEAYPEAKVVILNRDAESWYGSVLNSIYKHLFQASAWAKAQMIYRLILDPCTRGSMQMSSWFKVAMPYDHGKEKDKAIAWYEAQYDEFRARIPAERRMEYSVKDGWEPLCKYLDVPVPMVQDGESGKMVVAPFPHLNDRETFTPNAMAMKNKGMERAHDNLFKLIGKATVLGATGYGLVWAWKSRLGGRL